MFGKPGGQFVPVARKYCVAHGLHSAFPLCLRGGTNIHNV